MSRNAEHSYLEKKKKRGSYGKDIYQKAAVNILPDSKTESS